MRKNHGMAPTRPRSRIKIISILLLLALLVGAGWAWTPDIDRTELEARYAQPPSRFVEAAGLRWHVRETGPEAGSTEAPPVLMLHGFGSSLHTWEAWSQGLQAAHRVVRIDLPGAGLTSPDPQGLYDDEHTMVQLLALMDALNLPRASFIGHSMGGRLAWRMAAEHPQRVARLVLVAPDGFASPGFEYGKAPDVGFLAGMLPYALPRPLLRAGLAPAYADPSRLTANTITRYHQLMLAPGVRRAVLQRLEQLRLKEPTPLLARIEAPTLLIWGEADAMIPPANAQDYLRALPPAAQAELLLLPGLGHVPQEEDPASALSALQRFLAP